jgi:hypothetical protein
LSRKIFTINVLIALIAIGMPFTVYAGAISLSPDDVRLIGEKVFKNECSSKDELLLQWNDGEDFLSLGIGHSIWYPKGKAGPFKESFPEFISYAKASGAEIPKWLDKDPIPPCPWTTKRDFELSKSDPRRVQLKEFLMATKPIQAALIVKRLEEALPLVLNAAQGRDRENVALQFDRVASTSSGVYALADYVNFKGLGTSTSEKYKGRAWGLLQVLSGMHGKREDPDALKEFVRSANIVLTERVNSAPALRNESRWLPGWRNRINSYLE